MATATIDIVATLLGILGDSRPSWRFSSSSPIGESDKQDLSSGNNTITIPTGTTLMVIEPPSGNATAWTVKGVNGDTGWAADPDSPQFIAPASGVTSIVLNAASGINGFRIWFF